MFIFYISKVIHNTIINQIENLIEDAMGNFIKSLEPDQKKVFDNLIMNMDLEKLKQYYEGPAPETIVNNQWVQKMIISTILILVFMTLLIMVIIKFHCGYNIYLIRIIVVNIIIFISYIPFFCK